MRTVPVIAPPPGTASVLIFALSGLGKTTLCREYPEHTYDTDIAMRDAIHAEFGGPSTQTELFLKWRAFARSPERKRVGTPEMHGWARVRRHMRNAIMAHLLGPRPLMIVTNLLDIAWYYSAYYGVELGGYERHFLGLGRAADNEQCEEKNTVLEGYEPLVRLTPGTFLSGRAELLDWLRMTAGAG